MITLKINILVFIPLLFLMTGDQNKKACKVYTQKLTIIKDRLDKKAWQDLGEVNQAINFFEEVTKITSHSNGNYFGRYSPTKEDYDNWLNWFKENHLRLYWDKKLQKVMVSPLQSEINNQAQHSVGLYFLIRVTLNGAFLLYNP